MVIPAAVASCALLAGLGVFQLLLAAGRPLGRFAWGGQHDVLPPKLRIGSAVSVALYAVFAAIILDRAGVTTLLPTPLSQVGIWVLAAFFVFGALANLMSRSKAETYVMTPLALLLGGLTFVVAMGAPWPLGG